MMSSNTPETQRVTIQQAFDLALQHHRDGRLVEAEKFYRQILVHQPDNADALHLLGVIAAQTGKQEAGAELIKRAISLNPNSAVFYINLSIALVNLHQSEAAMDASLQAVRLNPASSEAHNNLGVAFKDLGRLDDAITAYRRALQLKPDDNQAWSNVVYTMLFHPAYDAAAIYEELLRWRARYAQPLKKLIQPYANSRDPERRLKIGYLSPDFFNHSQSFFMLPLLKTHDHRQFEITCYSKVSTADQITDQIRGYADIWRNVQAKNPEELAQQIRSDQIDILVDLTMHMGKSNLLVFARKPAPVQVAWLAYPGSTGLDVMDYRLTDPCLDPVGLDDAYYSEESFRLPNTFWCYDPLTDQPQINDLPAIKNGFITFGCLNNFCKINDGVLKLWAGVFAAVPDSRLMLMAPAGRVRKELLNDFGKIGVDPQRIELIDFARRQEYLKLYHRIDVGLDTLPYNGHTTSLDSFWMGVPVVTLIGKTVVGRAGWSQLCNLGLPELAAKTPEEYVDIITHLVGDLPRLRGLRSMLRQKMQFSPLMDIQRFARNIESAYRQMWLKWCASSH
ncbi:MAG TPA: tetratricopeptide repeat protein [Phycisphaerae bacterium]|nr:tetratricopeptide repeat protein [Phycisphaerae bacterium]